MKLKKVLLVGMSVVLCLVVAGVVLAEKSKAELIADAESVAPASVTKNATIKASDGKVLREGSNGWTCYPGSKIGGSAPGRGRSRTSVPRRH